jgi:membrane protein DedA with SNARE-associated domain
MGGYLTWSAGRKGGEVTLERYVPARILGRVKGWVEKYGAWSVAVAAILPPPIPLTPFLVAGGALKMTRLRFMLSYAGARIVRYGLLAWLGITYGRHIVRVWQHNLDGWSMRILWIYGGLVVAGIAYGVWKYKHHQAQANDPGAPAREMA